MFADNFIPIGEISSFLKTFKAKQTSDIFTEFRSESNGCELIFQVDNVNISILNALRRVVLSKVKTVNIDSSTITMIKNTSVLHDEMLSHRITMAPIWFNDIDIEHFDSLMSPHITWNVQNMDTQSIKNVTTEDCLILDASQKIKLDINDFYRPCSITGNYPLLVKLRASQDSNPKNGEMINVTARLKKGCGSENVHFSPSSSCYVINRIDPLRYLNRYLELYKDDTIVNRRQYDNLEGKREFIQDDDGNPTSFEFHITSDTNMSPAYIIAKAFECIIDMLENLSHTYVINEKQVIITLYKADHTLGNLLQSLLYQKWIVNENCENVEFIGYHQPHPLEEIIIIKYKNLDIQTDDIIFLNGVRDIIESIENMLQTWISKNDIINWMNQSKNKTKN